MRKDLGVSFAHVRHGIISRYCVFIQLYIRVIPFFLLVIRLRFASVPGVVIALFASCKYFLRVSNFTSQHMLHSSQEVNLTCAVLVGLLPFC